MVNQGCFPEEEMSMQRIRRFPEENPTQVRDYLTKNPSYIFFKASQTSPVGAMGVPVTPTPAWPWTRACTLRLAHGP